MALGVRPATRVHVHTRTTQYALCCSQQDIHYNQTRAIASLPPAWQCHSHDCTVFSQGWRGWVFERKRGWLLRVRWPAVALFWRTRLGVPRTRSKHEFALCETRDRIRAQLVSACFGYVTRVKRVSLSLRCLRCQGLAGFVVVVG